MRVDTQMTAEELAASLSAALGGLIPAMSYHLVDPMKRSIMSSDFNKAPGRNFMNSIDRITEDSDKEEKLGPLHDAASKGKMDTCQHLVENLGFDVNIPASDGSGKTPLACSVSRGKVIAVRYLLCKGADLNKQDVMGFAPLHYAAKQGYDGIARLLLSRGANVDANSSEGTPLHVAAAHGEFDVMQILLEHHADPNRVSSGHRTPLAEVLFAADEKVNESGCLKCMKLLVKAGADLNSTNPDTPLVISTRKGFTRCVNYLLEVGADANIGSKNGGITPIEIAAKSGRRDLVESLLHFTSRILTVSDLSAEGIIAYASSIPTEGNCFSDQLVTTADVQDQVLEQEDCTNDELRVANDNNVVEEKVRLVKQEGAAGLANAAKCNIIVESQEDLDDNTTGGQDLVEQAAIVDRGVTTDGIAIEDQNKEVKQSAGDKSRATKDGNSIEVNDKMVDQEDVLGKEVEQSAGEESRATTSGSTSIKYEKHTYFTIVVKENSLDLFGEFEQQLREILAVHPHQEDLLENLPVGDSRRMLGPHPLLEGQTNRDPPTRWIHIRMELPNSSDWVVFHTRADNVYIKGFSNEIEGEEFCYEFLEAEAEGVKTAPHLTRVLPEHFNAVPLPWDVKYRKIFGCSQSELEDLFLQISADLNFIPDTIRCLSNYRHGQSDEIEARRRVAGTIFRLCEILRMRIMESDSRYWVGRIQGWSRICKSALQWKASEYKVWTNPEYLKRIGITCASDAIHCLLLVLNDSKVFIESNKMREEKQSKRMLSMKNPKGKKNKYGFSNVPENSGSSEVQDIDGPEPPTKDGGGLSHGQCRIQLLDISANFAVEDIIVYDGHRGQAVYCHLNHPLVELKSPNLVLTGPQRPVAAYGLISIDVFGADISDGGCMSEDWDPCDNDDDGSSDEPSIWVLTVETGSGSTLDVTYLLIPDTVEADIFIRLLPHFEHYGFYRHCLVYGTVKAWTSAYEEHRVSIFNRTVDPLTVDGFPEWVVLPLAPSLICLPNQPGIKITIEVDLVVEYGPEKCQVASSLKFKRRGRSGYLSDAHGINGHILEVWISMCT